MPGVSPRLRLALAPCKQTEGHDMSARVPNWVNFLCRVQLGAENIFNLDYRCGPSFG